MKWIKRCWLALGSLWVTYVHLSRADRRAIVEVAAQIDADWVEVERPR